MSAMSFVTSTSSLRYPQSTARAMVLDLQPALRRLCHGFRARANTQLPEERLDMELDRVERDVEAPRDRLVRQAFGDRAQHLDLARREEHAPLGLRQRGETDACFLHDHVRRLRRFHDFMAGRDDHRAQLGAERGILRADRHAQAPRRLHRCERRFAHAAGRASIVASSESTMPPRITRSSALRPMPSAASCVAIRRRLRVGVPSTVSTMSPATSPALAAGPPSTIDITITPLGWPACSWSASGTATG